MAKDIIGVDISKDYLDVHRISDGASRRFATTEPTTGPSSTLWRQRLRAH